MGLDMMLYRTRYLHTANYIPDDRREVVTLRKGNVDVPLTNPVYLKEEILYWRKANQIHHWFVQNVQNGVDDCKEYEVSLDDLRKLRDLCNQALADNHLAETLLPPQRGFFFGSTEIDEFYFDKLRRTVESLDQILSTKDDCYFTYSYRASW